MRNLAEYLLGKRTNERGKIIGYQSHHLIVSCVIRKKAYQAISNYNLKISDIIVAIGVAGGAPQAVVCFDFGGIAANLAKISMSSLILYFCVNNIKM